MAELNPDCRSSASEVKEIFDTVLTDSQLRNWINMAAETVNDIESNDPDGDLSDSRLKLIEMNLSAHYASTQDPRISEETVGDASRKYKGTSEVTDYWRTAVQLDTTETLSQDGSKPSAGISVLDGRNIE